MANNRDLFEPDPARHSPGDVRYGKARQAEEDERAEPGLLSKYAKAFGGQSDYRAGAPTYGRFGYKTGEGMAQERGLERRMQYGARNRQVGMNDLIAQRARGEGGPSVAELQMQRGLGAAQAAATAQAAGARGMSRGAKESALINAQGNLASQNVANTGLLRAQEQIAAQELAQRGFGQERSQDLQNRGLGIQEELGLQGSQQQAAATNAQIAQGNAQRGQSAALFAPAAFSSLVVGSDIKHKEVYSRGMPSDYSLKESPVLGAPSPGAQPVADAGGAPLGMYLNVPDAPTNPEVDAAQQQLDALEEERKTDFAAMAPEGTQQGAASGQMFGAGLAALMSSDFRGKEITIRGSKNDLDDVIPTGYQYKPEASARMAGEQAQQAAAQGASPSALEQVYESTFEDKREPRNGIVAQDLQRSPAFKDSVVQGEAGLAVDRDRALSEALYQLGGLDKRLKAIEKPGDQENPNESAEVRQDFSELEAMLGEQKPKKQFSLSQDSPQGFPGRQESSAERFVRERMRGGESGQRNDETPKLDFAREGADRVIVIDEGMKSDYYDKDMPSDYTLKEPRKLQKGVGSMGRFASQGATLTARGYPQYHPPELPPSAPVEPSSPGIIIVSERMLKQGDRFKGNPAKQRATEAVDATRAGRVQSQERQLDRYNENQDVLRDMLDNPEKYRLKERSPKIKREFKKSTRSGATA